MKKLTKAARTLLIQLLILLGLLLCVEIALRLWFPVDEPQAVERKVSQNLPGLKSDVIYQSGRYGLRSLQTIAKVKPANQIRILCLGASTTEQTTQETQDTWCGQLESLLKKRFSEHAERFQTMALGVGGYRAMDNAFWLQEHIDRIKPDVVITLLGINDLAWNGGKDYQYSGLETAFAQKSENQSSNLMRNCKAYSQLCHHLIRAKQIMGTQLALSSGEVVEWHSENLPKLREQLSNYPESTVIKREPDPFDEFQDATQWIADHLKKKNIALVMLGQPVLWQADMPEEIIKQLWFSISTSTGPISASGQWLHKEMERYNTGQQKIARNTGAYYRGLDDLIPKTLDYYFDDCHFTDKGSKKVAMSILPVLSKVVTAPGLLNPKK